MNYLHNDQQIAHLDVKPENIMLTKKDRAKLIDFGWAVDLRKQKLIQGAVGTTSYAAPEVFGKKLLHILLIIMIMIIGDKFSYKKDTFVLFFNIT